MGFTSGTQSSTNDCYSLCLACGASFREGEKLVSQPTLFSEQQRSCTRNTSEKRKSLTLGRQQKCLEKKCFLKHSIRTCPYSRELFISTDNTNVTDNNLT